MTRDQVIITLENNLYNVTDLYHKSLIDKYKYKLLVEAADRDAKNEVIENFVSSLSCRIKKLEDDLHIANARVALVSYIAVLAAIKGWTPEKVALSVLPDGLVHFSELDE